MKKPKSTNINETLRLIDTIGVNEACFIKTKNLDTYMYVRNMDIFNVQQKNVFINTRTFKTHSIKKSDILSIYAYRHDIIDNHQIISSMLNCKLDESDLVYYFGSYKNVKAKIDDKEVVLSCTDNDNLKYEFPKYTRCLALDYYNQPIFEGDDVEVHGYGYSTDDWTGECKQYEFTNTVKARSIDGVFYLGDKTAGLNGRFIYQKNMSYYFKL